VIGATFASGTIADCVVCPPCILATIIWSPSSSGRLTATDPSVRKHGSKYPRIRAPPSCIVDGPNNCVDDAGAQSGEALTVLSRSDCCMVVMSTSLTLVILITGTIGVGLGDGDGDGDGLGDGDGDGDGLGDGDGDGDGLGDGDGDGDGLGDGDGDGDGLGDGTPSWVRTGVAKTVRGKVGSVNGVATPVGGGVAVSGQNIGAIAQARSSKSGKPGKLGKLGNPKKARAVAGRLGGGLASGVRGGLASGVSAPNNP
jgi:hypothetical protein